MTRMYDLAMLHHECARQIESRHGVDHEEAKSERINGDHMVKRARLYERAHCRKAANDV